jgi:glycosyltransferase involved in cell wall biosynthesis
MRYPNFDSLQFGHMPKVALFYDWLNQWGGAEKVLLNLIKIYPDAPIFTLVYDPKKTSWLPKNTKIIPSFINNLPNSKSNPIYYTPLYPLALEQFDFSQFDILISTTSTIGYSCLTLPKTLHVCFFHNINRHLYSKSYLKFYQSIDKIYINRPDYYLCNSLTVQKRLHKTYGLYSKIINPGIDTDFFVPSKNPSQNYFLVVSRLVPHKKINLAIKACGQLGLNLKIVGSGRQMPDLKKLASNYSTISFLGAVDNIKLRQLYQHCLALICPQEEDWGLTALEAQACGKPVIAYGLGGYTETVINNTTGLFFMEQTEKSLVNALNKFSALKINRVDCVNQARRFSDKNFMLNFKRTIQNLWQQTITI